VAYETPTAAELIARFPAFASVDPATLDVYISDAATDGVDRSWSEGRYKLAIVALAAHNMALLGIGDHGQVAGYARQGLAEIKTGNFSAKLGDATVARASRGGLDATPYGQQYKLLLRREKGGPRVVGAAPGAGDWGHIGLQNNGGYTPWTS